MNKRIKLLITFLAVTFLAMGFKVSAFGFTGAGAGTVASPYIIMTPAQLSEMRNNLTAHYRLGADINMTGIAHVPIGNNSTPFRGSLDGEGYVIKNLKVNGVDYVGLFGRINSATIKNITIEDADITGNAFTGIIAGVSQDGKMYNCSTSGNVSGSGNLGGLVGTIIGGGVEKSYSKANIVGDFSGGLIGSLQASKTTIKESYFAGNIKGTSTVGGILGVSMYDVNIEDCFVSGRLESGIVGGIIASTQGTNTKQIIIKNSYFGGTLVSTGTNKFGLANEGIAGVTITNSYFDKSKNPTAKYLAHGKTTAELKQKATYVGWDFNNIWAINEGNTYPYFRDGYSSENTMSGSGTVEEPYIVTTPDQLSAIRYGLSAHYKIGNDIDMAGVNFKPIGTYYDTNTLSFFTGSLDGDGYKIKNLKVSGRNYTGLFEYALGAEFKNITIIQANIIGENNTGILAGYANQLKINNCNINGAIKSSGNGVGGLVGFLVSGSITRSQSSVIITATQPTASYYGGLAGRLDGGTVKKSSFTGQISKMTSINYAGGILGMANGAITIEDCFSTGRLDGGTGEVGGIIGYINGAPVVAIKNSYYTGTLFSTSANKYGIADESKATLTITNSYFDKTVNATTKYPARGKTTAELKQKATYIGWDFNSIWAIPEGNGNPYFRISESTLEGSGTVEAPYIITTPEQLSEVRNDLSAHYKLGNDIDMSGVKFVPIGTNNSTGVLRYFTGSLDGDGKKIQNLKTTGANYVGLFEYLQNAEIRNLTVEDADVYGSRDVGIIAGRIENSSIINCSTSGKIKVEFTAGGMVGYSFKSRIEKSYSTANITIQGGGNYVGGITATANATTIKECYYIGDIDAKTTKYVAGISGNTALGSIIENCFASGTYEGGETLLAGISSSNINYKATIKNSYFAGELIPSSTEKFGLVDESSVNLTMESSYFDKTINGGAKYPTRGKTTEEMQQKATYVGWDFENIWGINEGSGMPYLRNVKMQDNGFMKVNDLKVAHKTNNSIKISWMLSDLAESYEVAYGEEVKTITENTIEITGLLPDTEYTIRVRGKNATQYSEWKEIKVKTYKHNIGTPTEVVMVDKSSNTATITWGNVEEANLYEVNYGESSLTTNSNKIVIGGLEEDTEYSFTVKAKNEFNTSEGSLPLIIKTNVKEIENVIGLRYTNRTDNSITLSWGAIKEATKYEVKYGDKILTTAETKITIPNLASKTEYTFSIRAISDNSEGKWDASITVTTLQEGMLSQEQEMLIHVVRDESYDLAFMSEKVPNINEKIFILRYDPYVLEVEDLASQTVIKDKTIGKVLETDIEIIKVEKGIIEFKINKELTENELWSGILNIVKFKALHTRSTYVYLEY